MKREVYPRNKELPSPTALTPSPENKAIRNRPQFDPLPDLLPEPRIIPFSFSETKKPCRRLPACLTMPAVLDSNHLRKIYWLRGLSFPLTCFCHHFDVPDTADDTDDVEFPCDCICCHLHRGNINTEFPCSGIRDLQSCSEENIELISMTKHWGFQSLT